MKRHQRNPSKFLSKEDCDNEITACIDRVETEQLTTRDGHTEKRTVCYFTNGQRPFVVNVGNWDTIAELYGDDDDDWGGQWITLCHDPGVVFGGKRVGGIRVKPAVPDPEAIRLVEALS